MTLVIRPGQEGFERWQNEFGYRLANGNRAICNARLNDLARRGLKLSPKAIFVADGDNGMQAARSDDSRQGECRVDC